MGVFDGVADTLYIPLAARVTASKRFPQYFYDAAALRLEAELPSDSIQKNASEYYTLASVARYHNIDEMARGFVAAHGACDIVNMGAGLETMHCRLADTGATFYEIDMPRVIAHRRRALGIGENEVLIGGDLRMGDWMEQIELKGAKLFVACGVFMYWQEEEVRSLIGALQARFGGSELVFDAMSASALKFANRHVRKTGNEGAKMGFSIDNARAFARSSCTELLECRPFFRDIRSSLGKQLKLSTRISMAFADGGMGKLVRLRL
ncbi:MAG: class I SAM-dependent methyltransferase [Clostridia bacterium]|nr:class I SAM-dependent methyltransferase [Clostridia bacterium]